MATDPNAQTITVTRGIQMLESVTPIVPGGGDDDVTGWTLRFRVFRRVGAAALVTLTIGSGITLIDAVNGRFEMHLTPDQTAALAAGTYAWDLERTDVGFEAQIAGGPFIVEDPDGATPAPPTECPPPEYPAVYGTLEKNVTLRAQKPGAVVPSGTAAGVRLTLYGASGRPVVVSAEGGCGSADAQAKISEVVCGLPVDAGVALSGTGDTVLVALPESVYNTPGVYEIETRIINANNAAIAYGRCWLYVDPSGFGGYLQGPPPFDEVRLAIKDYPQANRLLGEYEFSVAEVAAAVAKAVRRFNTAPPPSLNQVTTARWPRGSWANLLDGIRAELFETAAALHRRNHLPYSAGGVAVDDSAKEKDYLAAVSQYRQAYDWWVKMVKTSANLEDGFADGLSVYAWGC